jgi:hypothetical protein
MSSKQNSDWRAGWGILWRSLVFTPYMLAAFVVITGVSLSVLLLPLYAALSLWDHDSSSAGGAFVLWLAAVSTYRRFRLCRFYESPPSVL